jgi:hypothetical protein
MKKGYTSYATVRLRYLPRKKPSHSQDARNDRASFCRGLWRASEGTSTA